MMETLTTSVLMDDVSKFLISLHSIKMIGNIADWTILKFPYLSLVFIPEYSFFIMHLYSLKSQM